MKLNKIFWGLGFIFLAVALLLNALGVIAPFTSAIGDVSFITLLGGLLLLAYVIDRLIKCKFGEIFIPLAFIFMMFEKNIAHLCGREDPNMINDGLLFGCACLLWLGFNILLPKGRRRRKKARKAGHTSHCKSHWISSSLTSTVKYINAEDFSEEWVENNFGSCVIRFENADKYTGGGVLHVENNLGSMVIEVPSSWKFIHDIDNSLGSVQADVDGGNPDGALLTIKGENNLGSLVIRYV